MSSASSPSVACEDLFRLWGEKRTLDGSQSKMTMAFSKIPVKMTVAESEGKVGKGEAGGGQDTC